VQFVGLHDIDPVYYDQPFYVLPAADSDGQAYVVLREALRQTKKVGLGQVVIRGKGAVVAIKACGDGLMMETLHYADELKKAESVFKDVPRAKPEADMVDLAQELIERRTKKFDASAFKDAYEVALHELIEAKAQHRQVRTIEEPQPSAKVINLMDALRRSVGKAGKSSPAKRSKAARAKSSTRKSRRPAA
jgi:DNA end-binding protein Ku